MAIKPNTLYPTKTTVPSLDYPQGGARDVGTPGDGTGTPWTAAVLGDFWGWIQGLFSKSATTPSGSPDTARISDIWDSCVKLHGITIPKTTDALTFKLGGVESFESRAYGATNDRGGSRWIATGITTPGSAGTINWAAGLLYDVDGVEFSHDSPEITFESFNLQYAAAVTYGAASGKAIRLLAGATYALGATTLSLPSGAALSGQVLGDGGAIDAPKFTYTGAGFAIATDSGGAPRENILLENFRVEALSAGGAVWVTNSRRVALRGITATADGAAMILVGGGDSVTVEDCRLEKVAGVNNAGIRVIGSNAVTIKNPVFVNPATQDWTQIDIQAGSYGTTISGVYYTGLGAQAPISDAGERTIFLDGTWHRSKQFDLSGAYQQDGSYVGRGGYVNRIFVVYDGPAVTGVALTTLKIGKASGSPGALTSGYFWNGAPTPGTKWEAVEVAPGSWANADLTDGDLLMFETAASIASGFCHLAVEVLPYRGRK
jgi:hypothetical protein